MAMLCYFPSGVLADHFSARKLMSFSLFATALGGIYFALIPGQIGLSILFGYWGVTTILLFWAAMLRATREWGGKLAQGRAFGILDGGRGLISAIVASIAVFVLALYLPKELENTTPLQRTQAIKAIMYFYSLLTFATGILVWYIIPETKILPSYSNPLYGIKKVLKNPLAWFQAIIVICAYCGYRGLDFYALYAIDVLGMNEVSAAQYVANSTYIRPFAAIGAGFLADRFRSKRIIGASFTVLALCYLVLSIWSNNASVVNLLFVNIFVTYIAVYALRGVYFALFEESKIDRDLTGTTVGLISVVGFTPDIFFNSITGRILDAPDSIKAYQNFYLFLLVFAVFGIISSYLLVLATKKSNAAIDKK
jgi:sugar phosphate permease